MREQQNQSHQILGEYMGYNVFRCNMPIAFTQLPGNLYILGRTYLHHFRTDNTGQIGPVGHRHTGNNACSSAAHCNGNQY